MTRELLLSLLGTAALGSATDGPDTNCYYFLHPLTGLQVRTNVWLDTMQEEIGPGVWGPCRKIPHEDPKDPQGPNPWR